MSSEHLAVGGDFPIFFYREEPGLCWTSLRLRAHEIAQRDGRMLAEESQRTASFYTVGGTEEEPSLYPATEEEADIAQLMLVMYTEEKKA